MRPNRSHRSPNVPRSVLLRPLGILLALGLAAAAVGCSNPKKKAMKTIKEPLEKCRQADGPFYSVSLMNESAKTEVLTKACQEKMGKLQMEKSHSAKAKVGPYTWKAGVNEEIGIWVLKGVEWDTLEQARRRLNAEDPGENEIKHAASQLKKAQKTFPKSGWIRLERLRALIMLRGKTRDNESNKAFKLGRKASKHLEKTATWAEKNEEFETAAKARMQAIDYVKNYIRYIEGAKNTLGSQDDWYKKSIEVAKKEGNDKKAEKYEKELEKLKEERPEKRKKYDKLLHKARVDLCGRLAHLKPDGIEDGAVKKQVKSVKSSVDCQKLLKKSKGGDKGDSEGDQSGEEK